MKFLSLGAGVQSSVMLLLAIEGTIERPDHVIFSDTGCERHAVYAHLAWLRAQCEIASIPFHITQARETLFQQADHMRRLSSGHTKFDARPPLYVDGGSITSRQCTRALKVRPILKLQRELLGFGPRQRIPPASAVTMIGISIDEAKRAAPSPTQWIDNIFPLIDPLRMSRADCQTWWQHQYPDRTLPSSACIVCPYQSDSRWASLTDAEFEQAGKFDEQIRLTGGLRSKAYVHRSCRPLRDRPFEDNQYTLDLEMMCSGGCGL